MVEDYYEYNLKKYFSGLYMFAVTTHDPELQACWAQFGSHGATGAAALVGRIDYRSWRAGELEIDYRSSELESWRAGD